MDDLDKLEMLNITIATLDELLVGDVLSNDAKAALRAERDRLAIAFDNLTR